jgi:hypothetical protein
MIHDYCQGAGRVPRGAAAARRGAEDGTVVELSLKELHEGGHRLSAVAWRDLVEDYQLFTCRVTPHEESRRAQSARQSHPPA